jgi:hypothetical protein
MTNLQGQRVLAMAMKVTTNSHSLLPWDFLNRRLFFKRYSPVSLGSPTAPSVLWFQGVAFLPLIHVSIASSIRIKCLPVKMALAPAKHEGDRRQESAGKARGPDE